MCTALEAGLAQLEPFADLPWRQELSMVHLSSKDTISLGSKSSYAFNMALLKNKAYHGFVFSWLKDSLSSGEAKKQTLQILKLLEFADPKRLSPELAQVLDVDKNLKPFMEDPDYQCREPFSFRLMHTVSEPQWVCNIFWHLPTILTMLVVALDWPLFLSLLQGHQGEVPGFYQCHACGKY